MTYHRLPYDDAATPAQMASDCLVAERNLQLPTHGSTASTRRPTALAALATQDLLGAPAGIAAQRPAPRRHEVSDSLAELAAGLSLHFD